MDSVTLIDRTYLVVPMALLAFVTMLISLDKRQMLCSSVGTFWMWIVAIGGTLISVFTLAYPLQLVSYQQYWQFLQTTYQGDQRLGGIFMLAIIVHLLNLVCMAWFAAWIIRVAGPSRQFRRGLELWR